MENKEGPMLQTKSSAARCLLDKMNVLEKFSGCVVYLYDGNVAIFSRWREPLELEYG